MNRPKKENIIMYWLIVIVMIGFCFGFKDIIPVPEIKLMFLFLALIILIIATILFWFLYKNDKF